MTNLVTPIYPVWFDGEPISAVKAFKKATYKEQPLSEKFEKLTELKNLRTVHEVYELANSMRNHPSMVNSHEVYAIPAIGDEQIRMLDEVMLPVVFSKPVFLEHLVENSDEGELIYKEIEDVAYEAFHSMYPEDITEKYRVEMFVINTSSQDVEYNDLGLATRATYSVRAQCVPKEASVSGWAFIAVDGSSE